MDPATAKAEAVEGNFEPLGKPSIRPLQASSKAGVVWATVHDAKTEGTVVGRYDLRTFRFEPVKTLPKLQFSSMSMWWRRRRGGFMWR